MKRSLGQYMTPEIIADFMVGLVKGKKDIHILEPSSGKGIFIQTLLEKGFEKISAYEIDEALLEKNPAIKKYVKNESFVSTAYKNTFDLVIGNPPYIRWNNLAQELRDELLENDLYKQHLNAFADYSAVFILNSIEALKENGELIFITPDNWLNLTRSQMLRDYMAEHGQFSDLYLFKEAKVFPDANVSLMIFRYVKTTKNRYPKINIRTYPIRHIYEETLLEMVEAPEDEFNYTIDQFKVGHSWKIYNKRVHKMLTELEQACGVNPVLIDDICEIGNGMVSGLDKAFRLEASEYKNLSPVEKENTLAVLKGKDLAGFWYEDITYYLFVREAIDRATLEKSYPNFYTKLSPYRDRLAKRYSYNREIQYWEWAFLRNYKMFQQEIPKIFVPGKDRISHKDYFRFTIVPPGIYPTQDVTALIPKVATEESIEYITAYLNSHWIFEWLKNHGVTKGHIVEFTRKPVSSIPFLAIHFDDAFERAIHDRITEIVRAENKVKGQRIKEQIQAHLQELIDYRLG